MSNMQHEQPRGLAAAAQRYENQQQYSYPSPVSQTSSYTPTEHFGVPQPNPPSAGQPPVELPTDFNEPRPVSQAGDEYRPPLPQRHEDHTYERQAPVDSQYYEPPPHPPSYAETHQEENPPLPPRNQYRSGPNDGFGGNGKNDYVPPPPPQRYDSITAYNNDPTDPAQYIRDPHKLVAYLVPFPRPEIKGLDPNQIPTRFLIYTPPPPPLANPKEGEKEGKLHKVQRKWQQEVRSAKTSNAKATSWQGVKSRATKAIAWGVDQTTTSNLEFLSRVNDGNNSDSSANGAYSTDGSRPSSPIDPNYKPPGVNEMVLIYPPSIGLNDQQMREEFVNTMLRTKSKSQRDSIIATGLLPVGYGIDILATLIWPFGGLGEIDTVWLYSSIQGARTAGRVTKRLNNNNNGGGNGNGAAEAQLALNFHPSRRIDVLQRYLHAECNRVDARRFPNYATPSTESEVLEAIGWAPSQVAGGLGGNGNVSAGAGAGPSAAPGAGPGPSPNGEERSAEEDLMWEVTQAKEDVRSTMHKGAKEWKKFVVAFEKDPEKALKKK